MYQAETSVEDSKAIVNRKNVIMLSVFFLFSQRLRLKIWPMAFSMLDIHVINALQGALNSTDYCVALNQIAAISSCNANFTGGKSN